MEELLIPYSNWDNKVTLGNLHFPTVPAPQAKVLNQDQRLHKAQSLNGCIILFKLLVR